MTGIVLDTCAGPGGWTVGLGMLGITDLGIELDAAACATRAAAGHQTIRADISKYPVERLTGKTWGQVHSPPCTTFSMAGKRGGTAVTDILAQGIRDIFAGRKTRALRRREMARVLRAAWWPSPKLTRAERSAKIWAAVRSASLVTEPARYIMAGQPEWVALEQVPAVLPLWQVYAEELGKLGYHTWVGKLNSADYGVPQTRERVILIASRTRKVYRPEPTHYDPRKGMQLWGTPHVSMAEALSWGATGRPGPAVTAGGTSTGGAEPFPTRARNLLEAERDAGNWQLRRNRGAGLLERGGPRRDHPLEEPAPTITGGETGRPRLSWIRERPATTLQCGSRVFPPHAGSKGEHQSTDSVRISVQEAAVLQSFPADYPWQGTQTKAYEQVGNAVPPLLAMHIVAEATGIKVQQTLAA
jgi:DNA (cytosine-5)-methyltransferase 1